MQKNTGKYDQVYVAVRERLRRPVDEETLKLAEERRSSIAPCDNIGEITSPIVVMIAIGLESVFDSLAFERAPYFLYSGILGGWRNQQFRGEAPLMMTVVLVIRIAFCWVEVKVRAQHDNGTTTPRTAPEAERRESGDGRSAAKTRHSSMAVLYHRVVHSGDDNLAHMQYLAAALFALQPIIFVMYVAYFGKDMWSEAN